MTHDISLNEAFKRGMDAFVNDDFSESVEEFTKAIDLNPDFALTYASRGAALMKMHRIEESIADFDHAIELDPDYPKTYHLRGLARVEVEDYEGAWKILEKLLISILIMARHITAGRRFKSNSAEKTERQRIYKWSMSLLK